jgi:hypothetical protein
MACFLDFTGSGINPIGGIETAKNKKPRKLLTGL